MTSALVVGCGAIGGVVAAGLREGVDRLRVLSRNPEIARVVRQEGLTVRGVGAHRVPLDVVTELDPGERFAWIVLATPPDDVEAAVRQTVGALADGGAFVVMQNGLCEQRVGQLVGEERVLGAIVLWGASQEGPGMVRRTSPGGFVLGRLDGQTDTRLERLAAILRPVGPSSITGNLVGARWSKLAFNAAISTLGTVGGDRVGPLLRKMFVRRLALEILTESVAVAQANGVRLEKLAGAIDLPWLALGGGDRSAPLGSPRLAIRHALMLAVGMRYRNMRSSMLRALEAGRMPPVDWVNGEIIRAGERVGLAAPVNAAACQAVRDLSAGNGTPGLPALRELYVRTR